MALQKLTINGYGQIELNHVTGRATGQIEAQLPLNATDFATKYAENGMLLVVDKISKSIKLPTDTLVSTKNLPIALHYSSEHMNDERTPGLKNFYVKRGEILPRLVYLTVGDTFTTNGITWDDATGAADGPPVVAADIATEAALKTALAAYGTTAVYGGYSTNGLILVGFDAPAHGPILQVCNYTTMPDGQIGVKFVVLKV